LLLVILLALAVTGIWFYSKYGKDLVALKDRAHMMVLQSDESMFRATETSVCYYQDGTVMSVLKGEKDVYYLPYEAIPKSVVNAFLATEDRKFFEHPGYDIYAIIRAAQAYLKNEGRVTQGGSTITQQLARTIFLTNEKTVERKVTEIFLAAELEKIYSKEKILEFYINNVYFANGYYGIQAASEGYLGKSVDELTLSEAAFLCGIPNSPSDYNPRKRFDNAMERRNSVLKQMRENGYISGNEYNDALQEKPLLTEGGFERQDYAETFTYYCAVRAMMNAEGFTLRTDFYDEEDRDSYEDIYDEEYHRLKRSLYTKGYRIYTSLNREKQTMLQESINEQLADLKTVNEAGIYELQASGVCIDNETGFVVAIIGGRGQEFNGYTLNRAFQSPRQPGSSIKPLAVYTPVFENGYYPDTIVLDEKFDGGPRNSSSVYSGEIELRYAVAVSKNTIAWKLFEELTPAVGLGYLKRMGFSHLVKRDYVPAASLGGLTYGATALEMTSAYAALANGGSFRTPTCIMRITNADGTAIIDNTDKSSRAANLALSGNTLAANGAKCTAGETRIYQKNAALMMSDVLKTVMTTGTGRRLALDNMISAGKTGTTNDQKDGWFVGYTKYYTSGIWVGCDYPRKLEDLMGNTYPGHIWQDYMNKIHKGLPNADFEPFIDPRPKPVDTDGNGIPDDEEDADGDEIPDDMEDMDGDGIPDDMEDFDGDEIPDYMEDPDGDGDPNLPPTGLNTDTEKPTPDRAWDGLNILFYGEDGSIIVLHDGKDEDVSYDFEGKPAYYDDDGNRYYYNYRGERYYVEPDGYPAHYFEPGEWKLYDALGAVVLEKR